MSDRRTRLKGITEGTLDAIDDGHYTLDGTTYDLSLSVKASKQHTQYYAPDSMLSTWSNIPPPPTPRQRLYELLYPRGLHARRCAAPV